MRGFLPFLNWLPKYRPKDIPADLWSGLTVGVMLIPQGMAYAMIAGLPPVYGLYAALIPVIAYAFFGTSRHLGIGPVAMDSLLVAAGLGTLTITGPEQYLSLVILLALMVGGIQLVLGLLRMGFLVNFLSKPVVSGFISGAALIIVFSQLKNLFGTEGAGSSQFHKLLQNAYTNIPNIQVYDLLIGTAGIIIIIALKKWVPRIPAILIAVILGILVTYLFDLESLNVKVVGEIPAGLPGLLVPDLRTADVIQLWPIALTLALVGYLEAISIGKGIEEKRNEDFMAPNQELVALGLSNIAGSFFQSYPVSASFSRSAVHSETGARSNLAGLISALLVAVTLLFLTPVFYYLPNAILASIIMVSVIRLIDIPYAKSLWAHRKDEFFIWIVTFGITLFIGIMPGILIGVLIALLLMVYRTSKPHFAVLAKIKGTEYYKNVDRFTDDIELRDDLLIVRFDAQLYFGNSNYFKKELLRFIEKKGPGLQVVILNAEAINYIDSTATLMLKKLIEKLDEMGLKMYVVGAIGPARDILSRSGIVGLLPKSHFFVRLNEAVAFHDHQDPISPMQEKVAHQSKNRRN